MQLLLSFIEIHRNELSEVYLNGAGWYMLLDPDGNPVLKYPLCSYKIFGGVAMLGHFDPYAARRAQNGDWRFLLSYEDGHQGLVRLDGKKV